LKKFLNTWQDHQSTRAQSLERNPTVSSINTEDRADVMLQISRRLVDVSKLKNLLCIEAGLEMVALAMAILAQACNVRLC